MDGRRYPVVVTTYSRVILWVEGDSSHDAARRLNQQDPIDLFEAAQRVDSTDGGCYAATPDLTTDVYDEYTDVGPRLPDGHFYSAKLRAQWAADAEQRRREVAERRAAATLGSVP